jgi:subtilisin family serine protease
VNDPLFAEQWWLRQINIEEAWDITRGSPEVVIAIFDSGVDPTHEDWGNREISSKSYVEAPSVIHTHGTNVAGVAAASANNGKGIAGICPQCSIMSIRVYQDACTGPSKLADAIRYAVNNGADVINMSFSVDDCKNLEDVHGAINDAYESGVVIVASTGNAGTSSCSTPSTPSTPSISSCAAETALAPGEPGLGVDYPANSNRVLAVGASTHDDIRVVNGLLPNGQIWSSQYGAEIDLVAPGEGILTTSVNDGAYIVSMDTYQCIEGTNHYGKYECFQGTSASAPMVAGVAGLLLSEYPDLTPAQVRAVLRESSDDIGALGFDTQTGTGRLNAGAALSLGQNPPAVSPSDPWTQSAAPICTSKQGIQVTNEDTLDTYRTFRDEVLHSSRSGRAFINLYERHTGELVTLLLADENLRLRTGQFLLDAEDEFDALLPSNGSNTATIILDRTLYEDAEALVRDIGAAGNEDLRTDLNQVWNDLDLQQRVGDDVNDIWQDIQTSQNSVYLPFIQTR